MQKLLLVKWILFVFFPFMVSAQEPTRWRGPSQNGFYPETGLLKVWPESGPGILWHFDGLGVGYSSVSLANGNIYTAGMEGDNTGYVYCLSNDGKLLWKTAYGEEFTMSYYGSHATPVIAGEHLYILSSMGDLACMNSKTGQILWKKHLFRDFDGRSIQWGLNETPVIHGDWLICTPGGTRNNLVALNRFNGQLKWTSAGKGERSAYTTPLLLKTGTRNLLVTHTEDHILGVDADNGRLLWSYPHPNRYSIHPNTPLYRDNQVFCFSGYGQGGVMLELNAEGTSITKKWASPEFDPRIGGAVLLDGYIYGSGDENRRWQCLDWATGKEMYSTTALANGTVITADGLLYIYTERGELALVKPEPSGFTILSKTRVTLGSNQHWAHPVIDNGRLLIRHGNSLIVYHL